MWISTAAALLLVGSTSALAPNGVPPAGPTLRDLQETPAPPMTPDEARTKFLELEDEFDEARRAFQKEVRAKWEAHQAADDGSNFEFPRPVEAAFFGRFLALADAGVDEANGWVLMNYEHSNVTGQEAKDDKRRRLLAVLAGSPSEEVLTGLCSFLMGEAMPSNDPEARASQFGDEAAFAFLDVIRASAKSDEVKVMTLYSRGTAIQRRSYMDPSADVSEAAKWYDRAATEYPQTEIGQRCSGYVFAANHLQIGQVAPDIVGKDHDGNDIRRSDFEGKVTVLDFWGFW